MGSFEHLHFPLSTKKYNIITLNFMHRQGAPKVLSDSPGTVKLPVKLACFYDKLPDGQVVFAEIN